VQPVPNGPWYTVIGVAANVKNGGLSGADEAGILSPEAKHCGGLDALERDGAQNIACACGCCSVGARSDCANRSNPAVEIETLTDSVSKLADRPRFETALLGFFAFCGC